MRSPWIPPVPAGDAPSPLLKTRPRVARDVEPEPWDPARIRDALQEARDQAWRFADGSILGSMCTEPHALAREAYAMFLDTNLGDPLYFDGVRRMEQEALEDTLALLSAPAGASARLVSGGTEANILACYAAREATGKRRIVAPETAHFSFEKAARLLGMDLVRVAGRGHKADPDAMADAVDSRTALLIGVAGSTELGLVDDIPALGRIASRAGIALHVDAAFGGYVLPFLADAGHAPRPFAFDVEGVTSVGLDPHKMGMAPIPAGILALRDGAGWDRLAVETGYVSTDTQSTLMGTRPGAAAAAVWTAHRALGRSGYAATASRCLATTSRLADGLRDAGADLLTDPELNVVTFRDGQPEPLHARLAEAGFRLNIVPRLGALRIVVNPHVTDDAVDRFLAAYRRVIA